MPRQRRRFFLPCAPQGPAGIRFASDAPWLAPLAGYSDLPFRLLCREYGATVCETEMLSARGLLYESPGTGDLLRSQPEDLPLVVQLFGGDPESMGEAVLRLRKAGYSLFDCNMGCPVRKVMRQKAGAALVADQRLAFEIAGAMLAAARLEGDGLPPGPARVGFKLRLPPDASTLCGFARGLEEMGAAWISIHPRYAAQGYGGSARHEYTCRLVEALEAPVIASGDLFTAAAGHECIRSTGAAAVMYARGALSNPAIFARHLEMCAGRPPAPSAPADLAAMIGRHIELSRLHDNEKRTFVKMRSIIPRYVKGLPGVNELRQKLCACSDWAALDDALVSFMRGNF